MFNNIHEKLKDTGKTIALIGFPLSIIGGLILMSSNGNTPVLGIIILGAGCLFSWISSISLFGFGQLIENTIPKAPKTTDDISSKLEDIEANLPQL